MSVENKQVKNNKTIVLEQTIKTLAALNTLLTDATLCKNEDGLIFHLLNHSVSYIYYDRAILLNGSGNKILGVSGTSSPGKHTLLGSLLKKLKHNLLDTEQLQLISDDSFAEVLPFWTEYKEKSEGTSLLWLPLNLYPEKKQQNPVLILERWNKRTWRPSDIKIVTPLQKSFSGIWRLLKRNSGDSFKKKGRRVLSLFLLVVVIIFLYSYRVSERIVAPCEVVPENPASVTTAIDGVVEEILVKPGEVVAKDRLLVELDQEIFNEEYTAAAQQVKITRSELERTHAQAVNDLQARGRLSTLENQLKMDLTRLNIAKYRLDKSKIYAPRAGVIMMNDPYEWEGKPVMTGERIMLIITPSENKVKIYLPLDDKIDFPENAQVKIILNTDSATSRQAHLTYLSNHAITSPNNTPAFLAEAKFDTKIENIRMGVQGTAVIYGKKVSLGYWLIRRPLASLRNLIGI